MTLGTLYLFLVVLPNLHEVATSPIWVLIILALIIGGVAYMAGKANDEEHVTAAGKTGLKIGLIGMIILSLLMAVTPTSNQIYTIAGGYTVTNSKDIAKLPDSIVQAANAWLQKAADTAKEKNSTK